MTRFVSIDLHLSPYTYLFQTEERMKLREKIKATELSLKNRGIIVPTKKILMYQRVWKRLFNVASTVKYFISLYESLQFKRRRLAARRESISSEASDKSWKKVRNAVSSR